MTVHPTAIIDPSARIGSNVTVGAFSIIHANVQIGDNTTIESHCEIGHPTPLAEGRPLIIGPGSYIRSHSVFYEGSTFGPKLVTGHRVTVREKTDAGMGFQIGTLSDVQGHCTIGDYVRTHSNVHIGQASVIENGVWIFPYVVLTNDPTPPSNTLLGAHVGRWAVVATMSVLLPGVKVGEGALVGAGSIVSRDVEAHRIVVGNPAKDRGPTQQIKLRDGTDRPAYPWPLHFTRGYPPETVAEWQAALTQPITGI